MGRINWFIAGSIIGSVQILSYVNDSETLKEELR